MTERKEWLHLPNFNVCLITVFMLSDLQVNSDSFTPLCFFENREADDPTSEEDDSYCRCSDMSCENYLL